MVVTSDLMENSKLKPNGVLPFCRSGSDENQTMLGHRRMSSANRLSLNVKSVSFENPMCHATECEYLRKTKSSSPLIGVRGRRPLLIDLENSVALPLASYVNHAETSSIPGDRLFHYL